MFIHAKRARLHDGWEQDVRLTVHDGRITGIATGAPAQPSDATVDTLLPALANLHSHSFQRAMAGMTEHRTRARDSFWTWRELMYRFLDKLTPDHIRAIAALTFMEMQQAGYAAVGEFHYVHHQPDGQPYDDPAELSLAIMAAAQATGIGLTHLPVLYTRGGTDGRALAGGQLRFANTVDSFTDIVARCQGAARDLPPDTRIGVAPHSLRAVSPADLTALVAPDPATPVHIHIAEQTAEVEEITASYGARPVEWLLDHAPVGARWCLIHATHMSDAETAALARSGAVAGLCPVTEANLGDGIFNGAAYLRAGGRFGVGSDSNVNISLTEELRLLEYTQRLRERARNVMLAGAGSTGAALYLGAAVGGAQALARDAGRIEVGALADLVAIGTQAPPLCALHENQLLDGLVFAAKDDVVTDLWSAGRHQVIAGRHVARDRIVADYCRAIRNLLEQAA